MIIDTHVHFWQYNPVRDSWIDDSMAVLKRDFLPGHFFEETGHFDIGGLIAVQADQSVGETDFLLSIARLYPGIRAVVGWLDLCGENLGKDLEHYTRYPRLKGLRHIVQAESPGFMLQKAFLNGIARLGVYDLAYEILVYAPQLEEAVQLVKRFPDQRFVLDHIGKPDIRGNGFAEWKKPFEELSRFTQCHCKLSGMVTEAYWRNWTRDDLLPYLEFALECFGPSRLMFGSDWPVCKLAADYPAVLDIVTTYIRSLSPGEQAQIMAKNAFSFYQLDRNPHGE